jgi:hypothetical protein
VLEIHRFNIALLAKSGDITSSDGLADPDMIIAP